MAGCQNSAEDTLPCTNSTATPLRPATDSTLTVRRLVGTRSAVMPGSSLSIASPCGIGGQARVLSDINPATAAKGLNILTDDGLLESAAASGCSWRTAPGSSGSTSAASGSP